MKDRGETNKVTSAGAACVQQADAMNESLLSDTCNISGQNR